MSEGAIRGIEAGDAPALLAYFERLVKEDSERVERPEDAAKLTLASELEWIRQRQAAESSGEMVVRCVERDGEIVAVGELQRMNRWIERHVAEIRYGCLPSRAGDAALLVDALVREARALGVDLLVYFHLSTQRRGLETMRAAGFEEIGRIPGYYRRPTGDVDRVYLTRSLRYPPARSCSSCQRA